MAKDLSSVEGGVLSVASGLVVGIALCFGVTAAGVGYTAAASGVDKIVEELVAVNETIQSNAQQFSLVPYAEDPEVASPPSPALTTFSLSLLPPPFPYFPQT
jgi:hypothetical protein